MKSIGRSITLAEDLSDIDIANVVLLRLADDIGRTARYFSKKGSVNEHIIVSLFM